MYTNIAIQEGIYIHNLIFPKEYQIFRFTLCSKQSISQDALPSDIHYLIIRSNCIITNDTLLQFPNLISIGNVSTGTDNLQITDKLSKTKTAVHVYCSPNMNAHAVRDYVIESLLYFWQTHPIRNSNIGIIGYGTIGSLVGTFLEKINITHEIYDPFLFPQKNITNLRRCNIISIHVPLTTNGPFPTIGMLNNTFYKYLNPKVLFIQTSRGKVWESKFYTKCIIDNQIWAQDVYPTEPLIHKKYINSFFMTPHIAGYSTRGRLGGLYYIIQKMLPDIILPLTMPPSTTWELEHESTNFKKDLFNFTTRRKSFPWRKEFSEYSLIEQQEMKNRFSKIPTNIWRHVFYE